MQRSIRTPLMTMLVLALAPVALVAQDPMPQQPQLSPEVQGLIQEAQQLQAELAQVQERALQEDTGLQQEQEQVTTAVQEAMLQLEPELQQHSARFEELHREAQAAQQAEDIDRIIEITAEAEQLRQRIEEVQAEALSHPEVAPQVQAFQTRLQQKMTEIDPEVGARIQRLEELERELHAVLNQAG